jgi:hypothetical protein
MFRILIENGEVRERRNQLRYPVYQKPELSADQRSLAPATLAKREGRAQPGLVIGHHQADGTGEIILLLSVCHPGHLQPPGCRPVSGRR